MSLRRTAGDGVREPPLLRGRRRRLLGVLVVNGFGQAGAAVAVALLVERAFDELIVGGRATVATAAPFAAGLVAAAGAAAWLRARERVDAERLGQHYVHELRLVLFDRILAFSPRALDRRSRGAVAMRFAGDLGAVRQWVSLGLSRLLVGGSFLVAASVALAFINARLALVLAVTLVLGGLGVLAVGRPLRAAAQESRRRSSQVAGLVTERVGAAAVVHAFGQTGRERRRLRRRSRRLRAAAIQRARVIGGMRGLTEGIVGLTTAAVLLAGALEVAAGRASPGTVVAAMAVVSLLAMPVRDLGRVQEYWHGSRVALEKARQLLNAPGALREAPDAQPLPPGPGRLDLEDVRVEGALEAITATVVPGRVIAVVGPNGAGKSTLLAVAGRLLDPDGGRVSIDGHDLAGCTLDSTRLAIGLAGPDLPLLRGTIAYNLGYRTPDAAPGERARVRELCGIDGVVAELPDGEATRVSEDGHGLSAGQRQRVALARALLGDPAVLLLDEADANLDAPAREVVDRVVAEQRRRGSVLAVTHRRDLVERADEIWHLAGGRLVEVGPPGELLRGDGPTARLLRDGRTPEPA